MSQYNDAGVMSFAASAAISKGARVVLASDRTISAAGIADKEIGTALQAAFAAGDRVSVKLRTAPGTHRMIAAAAITAGAPVFTAASGKCSVSASTAFLVGIAIDAATANGDIIEVLYNQHGDTVVP